MDRHLIDRWTDNTTFGVVLVFSSVLVFPVLALGLLVSVVMLIGALVEQTAEFAGAVVVVLSVGGAAGLVGWLRAHRQTKRPDPSNPTATLACLAIGTATAFVVGGSVAVPLVESMLTPWGVPAAAWFPGLLFVAAHVTWVLSGIAWMQRLTRHYAERTGRAFDGIPVVLLVVAIALLTAVGLGLTAL